MTDQPISCTCECYKSGLKKAIDVITKAERNKWSRIQETLNPDGTFKPMTFTDLIKIIQKEIES